ncbi:unnamed protein product, partial [Polarella glacialis]
VTAPTPASTFGPPSRDPEAALGLAGIGSLENSGRWQESDTFAAIRRWVRTSPVAKATDMGTELDLTLNTARGDRTARRVSCPEVEPNLVQKLEELESKPVPQPKRRATCAAVSLQLPEGFGERIDLGVTESAPEGSPAASSMQSPLQGSPSSSSRASP